jgi:hypothetical protein
MRARSAILCVVASSAVASTIILIFSSRSSPVPPNLRLAKAEPIAIRDDNEAEMWLLTLRIRNSNPPLSAPGGVLFVKIGWRPSEIKSNDGWSAVERPWVEGQLQTELQTCRLSPGEEHQRLLVVPANARSCRIPFKYVGGVISYRTRLARLVQRLPQFMRSRVSNKFWRWAGFDGVNPGSNWQQVSVELPLPAAKPETVAFKPGEARVGDEAQGNVIWGAEPN